MDDLDDFPSTDDRDYPCSVCGEDTGNDYDDGICAICSEEC